MYSRSRISPHLVTKYRDIFRNQYGEINTINSTLTFVSKSNNSNTIFSGLFKSSFRYSAHCSVSKDGI